MEEVADSAEDSEAGLVGDLEADSVVDLEMEVVALRKW